MDAAELRALQTPLKERYRHDPKQALVRLKSSGDLNLAELSCRVHTSEGSVTSGLHPAAGGPTGTACSGDMLLDALVACAGVTLCAVATALSVPLRGGRVLAEAELDFRGTLGLDREVPVGIRNVQLKFELDSDAPREQLDKLVTLVERYCVIYQTLKNPPALNTVW